MRVAKFSIWTLVVNDCRPGHDGWATVTLDFFADTTTSVGLGAPAGRTGSTQSSHWARPAGLGHQKARPRLDGLQPLPSTHARGGPLPTPNSAHLPPSLPPSSCQQHLHAQDFLLGLPVGAVLERNKNKLPSDASDCRASECVSVIMCTSLASRPG